MTSASDGVHRNASDKTQCYEQLRTRIVEVRHTPLAVASAVVLVRQGMSAWMQLDDGQGIEPQPRDNFAGHPLPAPEHSELLAVLTSLVFDLCNHKESA